MSCVYFINFGAMTTFFIPITITIKTCMMDENYMKKKNE